MIKIHMTDDEQKEIYLQAFKNYGIEKQSLVYCEELSELTKEISKAVRKGKDYDKANMTEEIADVLISIQQLQCFYGISNEAIEFQMYLKLKRLAERMIQENKDNAV